eukprot:g59118.t1
MATTDENAQLSLEELKAYVTPSEIDIKKSREGLEAADPPTEIEEQKAAIETLPAGYDYDALENCLPEKGHAALLTLRRAGDAGNTLYWSKADADKPDYEGERARPRAEEKPSKRPECRPNNNRSRGCGNAKASANVAKEVKTAEYDEVDDAWVGMAIDSGAGLEGKGDGQETPRREQGGRKFLPLRFQHPTRRLAVDGGAMQVLRQLSTPRYEIVLGGPAGTRYQMPARYDREDLRKVYRRLYGFTDYGIVSPPTILHAYTRHSPIDIDYQPSRVHSTFTTTAIDPEPTVRGENDLKMEHALAYRADAADATPHWIFPEGRAGVRANVYTWTLVVHGHPHFGKKWRWQSGTNNPTTMEHQHEHNTGRNSRLIDFSTNEEEQISREDRQIWQQTDTNEKDEVEDESPIVVIEQNVAPPHRVARPPPPPPPLPPLEQVVRAEDTPVVLRNRNRPPSRRSVTRIQFVDSRHLPAPKPKAPRDIDGDVNARNIVTGRRVRRQTPENTATHSYKLAVAEDDDIQFASQPDTNDGLRYEDVCLFTRVLRKPAKQLRLIPQVVEARKKEIQGLYDAKCLEWATWQDADRDKVKPIRTGFVDAIKEGLRHSHS